MTCFTHFADSLTLHTWIKHQSCQDFKIIIYNGYSYRLKSPHLKLNLLIWCRQLNLPCGCTIKESLETKLTIIFNKLHDGLNYSLNRWIWYIIVCNFWRCISFRTILSPNVKPGFCHSELNWGRLPWTCIHALLLSSNR